MGKRQMEGKMRYTDLHLGHSKESVLPGKNYNKFFLKLDQIYLQLEKEAMQHHL